MESDEFENLHVIIARLEPAIALAQEQDLSVIAGLLVLALQEAQNQLKQEDRCWPPSHGQPAVLSS
ncbi:MAG: hypothetical protein AB7V46_16000 [Thermomicrobiales bacterium]